MAGHETVTEPQTVPAKLWHALGRLAQWPGRAEILDPRQQIAAFQESLLRIRALHASYEATFVNQLSLLACLVDPAGLSIHGEADGHRIRRSVRITTQDVPGELPTFIFPLRDRLLGNTYATSSLPIQPDAVRLQYTPALIAEQPGRYRTNRAGRILPFGTPALIFETQGGDFTASRTPRPTDAPAENPFTHVDQFTPPAGFGASYTVAERPFYDRSRLPLDAIPLDHRDPRRFPDEFNSYIVQLLSLASSELV